MLTLDEVIAEARDEAEHRFLNASRGFDLLDLAHEVAEDRVPEDNPALLAEIAASGGELLAGADDPPSGTTRTGVIALNLYSRLFDEVVIVLQRRREEAQADRRRKTLDQSEAEKGT